MKSGYIDLGDGKLYYEVGGSEDALETVVLSHAAFLDGRMWDAQWEAFIKQYRVVRYDMIGYGKSDSAVGSRCRRHDLLKLLQALNITHTHLIGCSMGGEIVLDIALEHPELVQSLVVVNGTPSGFEMQGEPPKYLFDMIGALQAGEIDRASELQLRIWFDGPNRQPEKVNKHLRQRAAEMNRLFVSNGTFFIADSQPAKPLDPPAISRLNEIQTPTLIVTGQLDHVENLRAADEMIAQIPQTQRLFIEDAAHVPSMEHPELFNREVLHFLN
ncbi:hypothetical protein MNBD_CHLOROFLEXI01-4236 [hydrothermal vent metagenome]|uniref:AB hydrolase-1 domain-containing protein n=1 Tax=hydrothermal vent metagenome TaxID=652676 RepID=A0A3B0UH12_9ZZZZ